MLKALPRCCGDCRELRQSWPPVFINDRCCLLEEPGGAYGVHANRLRFLPQQCDLF